MQTKKLISLKTLIVIMLSLCCNYASALDLLAYIPVNSIPAVSGKSVPNNISNAMVKIYASNCEHHLIYPKTSTKANQSNGSGFVIQDNMIITSAHVLADRECIEIRKYGEQTKYKAHVLSVSYIYDLALLTIDSGEFFQNVTPLEIGIPKDGMRDVSIYGFPGGEDLVVTEGLFVEIKDQPYEFSKRYLPAGKIQAEVKHGNSGGPVIADNKVVGLVMQIARNKNICLMVPGEVIENFISQQL